MRRTSLLIAGSVAIAACGGGDTASESLTLSATEVAVPPQLFYDVSPDGAMVSYYSNEEVCIAPVDDVANSECYEDDGSNASIMRWSPDSQVLAVVPDSLRRLEAGPITVLGVDGSRDEIAEPESPDDGLEGTARDAVFVDNDTIVYYTFASDDSGTLEFWSIDTDGSDHELLTTFEPGANLAFWSFEVADGVAYLTALEGSGESLLFAIDLAAGSADAIADSADGPSTPAVAEVSADGVLLVQDIGRLGDFARYARDGVEFWELIDGDRVVAVPHRDVYRTRSVALSPSGDRLAILEAYEGETTDGEEDPDGLLESEGLHEARISIATTESVLEGEPEWTAELTGFATTSGSADYDGVFTNIIWVNETKVMLELQDQIIQVDLISE